MKKFLLFLLILIVLVVAALGIFIATFDANRFRPQIIEQAQKALGAPVDLGRISLVWNNGIAARLDGIALYTSPDKSESSVKAQSISANLKIGPLLQKQVQISSLSVQNVFLHLVKSPDGKVQIKGVRLPESQPAPSSESASASSPVFSIDSIALRGAEIKLEDLSVAPPAVLQIRQLDANVKNFSLDKPFRFDLHAAVFSDAQNLRVSGQVQLPSAGITGFAENVEVDTDLSRLKLSEAAQFVPALASAGLETLSGKLAIRAEKVPFDPAALDSLKVDATLSDGAVKTMSLPFPVQNIQQSASVSGPDLSLKNFSANLLKGSIKASGMVKEYRTQALAGFHIKAEGLSIDDLTPSVQQGGPKLGGRLSVDFEGRSAGSGPALTQSLNGQGVIGLKDGVLLDYNLLRTVIQKISVIPGAEEMIKSRLPGIYKAKMDEPSTILKPVEIPISVQNGQVLIQQVEVATDVMSVRGSGQIGFDKSMSLNAVLSLDRDLSAAISAAVPQLDLLKNADARIEVPVKIQGRLPAVAVLPDTEYITQKVIAGKAQQLVTGIVQNPEEGIKQVKEQVKSLLGEPAKVGEEGAAKASEGLMTSAGGLQDLFKQAVGEPQKAESASQQS